MTFKNEDDIKKALGIDTWRNLSKDTVVKFAAMMPDMDKELAAKLIEKFPEFKSLALDALATVAKQHSGTLSGNKESQDQVHDAYEKTREVLEAQLQRDDLSAEERLEIMRMIQDTADREFEKDSENKKFLKGMFDNVTALGAVSLGLAVVFVGGKVMLGSGNDSK